MANPRVTPLAGEKLLEALREAFRGWQPARLATLAVHGEDHSLYYKWCHPLAAFLAFLARHLKLSAHTAYHDALKYFINETFLGGRGRLEVPAGSHRIDLVEPLAGVPGGPGPTR